MFYTDMRKDTVQDGKAPALAEAEQRLAVQNNGRLHRNTIFLCHLTSFL